MTTALRKLNEEGMARFSAYLNEGAEGPPPIELLTDPTTSEPLAGGITPSGNDVGDRYAFGQYLCKLLAPLDGGAISHERGLWTGLALVFFDLICPTDASGTRKVDKQYRYILSADYRHYYRHLVRSPWQLVRDHGENARFLLLPSRQTEYPLRIHGDILEQIGGRQQVLRSSALVAEASRLYADPETGRPRRGAAGRGPGSARRFGLVLRQLELTFDPQIMTEGGLVELLPSEFDRWKPANAVPSG